MPTLYVIYRHIEIDVIVDDIVYIPSSTDQKPVRSQKNSNKASQCARLQEESSYG